MDKIIALTHQQRTAILRQLTVEQIKALSEFTRYAMLSRFHTRHYLSQTDWEFQGMVVDPWYQRSHDHSGENLYCDCGRRLKISLFSGHGLRGGNYLLAFHTFNNMQAFRQRLLVRSNRELMRLTFIWIVFY